MAEPLPEDVRRFVDEYVESLDQLEILRVLSEDPGREWSAAEVATEIHAEPSAVAASLAALGGRGLLTLSARGVDSVARHGARTPELEDRVSRVLNFYLERPVTMIKYVYARANERLRAFSDAFRLRKED